MAVLLDHYILPVADLDASLRFYCDVLGFTAEGTDGPFTVVRVNDGFVLLLSPWGTDGGEHLAFAMEPDEFDEAFARIRAAGVAFGDSYHAADNGKPPGYEFGARGMGASLYLTDPSQHLIELRHYAA